jgi:hypothetical protein
MRADALIVQSYELRCNPQERPVPDAIRLPPDPPLGLHCVAHVYTDASIAAVVSLAVLSTADRRCSQWNSLHPWHNGFPWRVGDVSNYAQNVHSIVTREATFDRRFFSSGATKRPGPMHATFQLYNYGGSRGILALGHLFGTHSITMCRIRVAYLYSGLPHPILCHSCFIIFTPQRYSLTTSITLPVPFKGVSTTDVEAK